VAQPIATEVNVSKIFVVAINFGGSSPCRGADGVRRKEKCSVNFNFRPRLEPRERK
jgi:hypothetical protein